MNILEVNNISKSFGKKKILDKVSFNIKEGEILGFIGPNGAGKTTTIKLILGLQAIDSGNVLINGYDIKNEFVKAISNVGAIVESPDLYMYLSGYKNLELIARMYKDIDKSRIDEVVKLTGLDKRINDKVSKYSLGMRQRLGIAAALLNKPNLLILDEPTNGLDPEGIKEVRVLLKKLAKNEKMGILISSHNLAELDSFCTDVCIIKNGKIISTSTVAKIKKGEKSTYIFEVDKPEKLKKLLDYELIIEDNIVKIQVEYKDVPKIVEILVENNIKIYGIKELEMSLEEAFFKEAGGNIID